MEKRSISDEQISASSEYNANHAAIQGRLHFQAVTGKAGAWSSGVHDSNQWLQIDLGNMHLTVTGVATQGRNGYCCQWVTKYKLQYSDYEGNCDERNINCKYYREPGKVQDKVKCEKFSFIHPVNTTTSFSYYGHILVTRETSLSFSNQKAPLSPLA